MKFKKLKKFLIGENISFKENENIKNYTSIRIGGKVRFFIEIKTISTLIKVRKECEKLKIKLPKHSVLVNAENTFISATTTLIDSAIEKAITELIPRRQ